jgi:hypothetical protein
MLSVLMVLIAVAGCALLASIGMAWASNRSALWNMVLGGVLAFVVLAAAILIAWLMTSATYNR